MVKQYAVINRINCRNNCAPFTEETIGQVLSYIVGKGRDRSLGCLPPPQIAVAYCMQALKGVYECEPRVLEKVYCETGYFFYVTFVSNIRTESFRCVRTRHQPAVSNRI